MSDREPIPPTHTRLARVSAWLVLLGLILFPTGQIPTPNPRGSGARAPQPPRGRGYVFAVSVLPALCSVLGSTGLTYLSFRHRANHAWVVDKILAPAMMASLAGLVLVFYIVYKDGWTAWPVMQIVAGTLAAMSSLFLLGATLFTRRRAKKEAEMVMAEEGRDRGNGAPQIPEVGRAASFKDEMLTTGSSSSG